MPKWQKGESGNPFGMRPRINAFRTICQAYSKEVFEMLREMIENRGTHEAVRFQAMKFVIEQAWGRAPQSMEVRVVDSLAPAMMTTEQLKLAAAGQTQELVCNIIASGKLAEYTKMAESGSGGETMALLEELDFADKDGEQEDKLVKAKPRKGKK